MHWEVKYPEPKKPRPFDNYDLFTCLLFAVAYTNAILTLNWFLFIIVELCLVEKKIRIRRKRLTNVYKNAKKGDELFVKKTSFCTIFLQSKTGA